MTGSTNAQHHRRPAVFWVIAKKGAGHEEVLTLDLYDEGDSAKTMPVFCFEDEARMFLTLGTLGSGWRIKETADGELTSMLRGQYASVRLVSLDPLPELVYHRMIGLVNLSKEQFVEDLISKSWSRRETAGKESKPFAS